MATSPDNWHRDNQEQLPAPPSWNDADPNADGDGRDLALFGRVVMIGTVALIVGGFLLARLLIG
jgi:hypothetical protein